MSKPPYTDAEFEVIKGPDQPISTETVDDEAWDWAGAGQLIRMLAGWAFVAVLIVVIQVFVKPPLGDFVHRLFGG